MAEANSSPMMLFLLCTFAMFTLPFVAFFGVRDIARTEFGVVGFASTAWGVLGAVLTVNLIILVYVWRAYREERAAESAQQQQPKED